MLATSGQLQPKPAEGSAARTLRMIEMADNGEEARTIIEAADHASSRSVYLPLLRGVTPKSLEAFDPVGQSLVTGQRESTTVPTQALYLLNSAFVRKQSLALANRLLNEHVPEARAIGDAYTLTLNRAPSAAEVAHAEKFLGQYEELYRATPPSSKPPATVTPVVNTAPVAPKRDLAGQATDEERLGKPVVEEIVEPAGPKEAAWMSFVQALYGSAEFRFVR
jgi:hypothetical protein